MSTEEPTLIMDEEDLERLVTLAELNANLDRWEVGYPSIVRGAIECQKGPYAQNVRPFLEPYRGISPCVARAMAEFENRVAAYQCKN